MKNHAFNLLRISLLMFSMAFFSQLYAQKTITGTIMDGTLNETLIGGTVLVKGKTVGTVSDINGKYSIQASTTDVLIFSFTGYEKQEILVGNQTQIDVTLKEASTQLAEVVAIGYGTVKKSDITGSISVISTKELTKNPAASAAQALQGKAPGVLVSQTGAPGGGVTIRVRGVGSINRSSDPIFILDGVQVSNINGVQPNDIESFQVLKDASASAIYGANGSNGVIIITTKRGKAGKPQVNLNSYVSFNMAPKQYEVMNAQQYSDFYANTLFKTEGIGKTYLDKANNGYALSPEFRQKYYGQGWEEGTNWQSKLFKSGISHNYNLSVAGGGDNSNFNVSLGYSNEDGTIINNSFERYQIRANSDFKLNKHIKIGENLSANFSTGETPVTYQTTVWDLKASPLMRIYNEGNLGGFESYQTQYWEDSSGNLTQTKQTTDGYLNTVLNDKPNPLAAPSLGTNKNFNFSSAASVYAQVDIADWLMYKITPSAELTSVRSNYWLPKFFGNRFVGGAVLNEGFSQMIDVNLENLISIKKKFDDHNFQGTFVHQVRSRKFNNIAGSANGFDFEILNTLSNGGSATTPKQVTSSVTDYKMLSYLGRIIYDYKGKYFATASLRSDGISLFGPGHRRGQFFSGSLAWKINEDFFKDVKEIDVLKMRLGWGETGNSNIGEGFQYLNLITGPTNFYPVFGENQVTAEARYAFHQLGNPSLEWEKAQMLNGGFDLNMFSGKLQTSVEYYIKNNFDLLFQVPISAALGINTAGLKPWYNIATIQNRGVEISVQWRDKIGKLDYGIISNFTTIKNSVISVPSVLTSTYNRTQVGSPIGSLYGYVADGIIQLDESNYTKGTDGNWQTSSGQYIGYKFGTQEGKMPQPGDLKYKDLNGDGTITNLDKTIIGKTIPAFTYTIGFDCSYMNFDFNIFLFGVNGFDVFNAQRANLSSMNTQDQMHNKLVDFALNHWTPENASTTHVRVDPSNLNVNDQISSFWIEDGSFLRIKDLQLGYTLPAKGTKALGITSLRIYANASNVYNFTSYKGRDPEGFMSGNPTSSGVDDGDFANPRAFSCGLQIGF